MIGGRVLLGAAALAGLGAFAWGPAPVPGVAGWQEIAWPFPRDAWPKGLAFRCSDASCGGSMEVYVRPKIGFCNCTTGVDGDAEVDAVSDLDMIAPDYRPRSPGEAVMIGGMPGRVRSYVLTTTDGQEHAAAGFALSARCDLVVVASVGLAAGTGAARRGIVGLLETARVAGWIRSKLGKA